MVQKGAETRIEQVQEGLGEDLTSVAGQVFTLSRPLCYGG